MKNQKSILWITAAMLACGLLGGCGGKQPSTLEEKPSTEVVVLTSEEDVSEETNDAETEAAEMETAEEKPEEAVLPDGTYVAEFHTDNSMFHVNEACHDQGTLTVKDGQMTIHVTMPSKNVLHLYAGLAEDAAKDGAVLLDPTEDEVTYDDGMTETVFGYDIPVPYLDEEFDCALIGKKEVWYDHKVSVVLASDAAEGVSAESLGLEDGEYTVEVTLTGGSGRASIESPAKISMTEGKAIATIIWSSKNYDFMMVGEEKFLPVNTEGNSVFEIPLELLDYPMEVQADTVAMSEPHLIDYTLYFDSSTLIHE